MTSLGDIDDFHGLFLTPTPMLDLRAPSEFSKGAFPSALSLPLLSDEERAQVGICYKHKGQEEAIQLGHRLVSGSLKQERLDQWLQFVNNHQNSVLYCWRGGLRSATVQSWLAEQGVHIPRVIGGYKALRQFLLTELAYNAARANFVLISGKTGTGKTRAVYRVQRAIDLEGLANHRGSTFGQLLQPQPSQIDFENALSIALLRMMAHSEAPIYLEDEGRLVGRLSLPDVLRKKMVDAPLVIVEETLQHRTDVVLQDYIVDLGQHYIRQHGASGALLHRERLQVDLARIQKRLGGERYQTALDLLNRGFECQWRTGSLSHHRVWISFLLERYYDPMYDYQLEQRAGQCLFRGSRDAVIRWIRGRTEQC